MQKLITAAVVIVLIAVAVFLNSQLNSDSSKTPSSGAPASQAQQPQRAASTAAQPPYAFNTPTTGPADDEAVGDAGARQTLTIGYTWTPDLLKNQGGLKKVLADAEAWAAKPGRRLHVVCVDIPQDQREAPDDATVQEGVFLNGQPAPGLSGNPGDNITPAQFEAYLRTLK